MEKNRVSLGVIISIIIILVLLIGGAYLIYNYNNKIVELEKELAQQNINNEEKIVENKISNTIQSNTSEKIEKFVVPSIYTGIAKNVEEGATYQLEKFDGNNFYMYLQDGKIYINTNIEEQICAFLNVSQIKLKNGLSQEITGFSKKVVDIYIINISQNGIPTHFIFLMEDGTLEYSSLRNIATNLSSQGEIKDLKNIVKVQDVSLGYSDGGGHTSAIAIDKDNNYYDLAKYIN